jgi:hypothetical protein
VAGGGTLSAETRKNTMQVNWHHCRERLKYL